MALSVKTSVGVMRCNLTIGSKLRKYKPKVVEDLNVLLHSSSIFDVHMERLSDGKIN